ncbi:MAG: C-GCAxxG-C-C family protein [Saccharofermentans sp.]|nr:C-GCAxxG-C-C family protein [Saccharofermentans sp.]
MSKEQYNRAGQAASKFGKMMCGACVLTTYAEESGLKEPEIMLKGMMFSGGKMGTCGAVLACQEVLKNKRPDKVDELEERFISKNTSSQCKVLKGRTGGPMLRSCPGCIEDACSILDEILNEDQPSV